MTSFDPRTHPHRRCAFSDVTSRCQLIKFRLLVNPLINEYILVSPNRNKRPWLGQTEAPQLTNLPQHDANCYLCPGNTRSGGQKNEAYHDTMIFENDFPAVLSPPGPVAPRASHALLTTDPVHGSCDVLIFHPRHDLTMARLSVGDIVKVVNEWIKVYRQRGKQEGIKYVQIFEVRMSVYRQPSIYILFL